jgi:WD40 repeat protein
MFQVTSIVLSLTLCCGAAAAEQPAAQGLYDRPVLVVDPGMHTAMINRADADRAGSWGVTGSDDKTVRVWSLADGQLARTIRPPTGPGNVGQVRAVAISPDGKLIAAGGWIGSKVGENNLYLFDRVSGMVVKRIGGLPEAVDHLTFSPDGHRLAAVLWGSNGIRLYGLGRDWDEIARDEDYRDQSYGAVFAPDGRLATTSWDGKVRLYAAELKGTVRPAVAIDAPSGHRPYGIVFSPADGARLAVGYDDSATVTLLDGHTLARLRGPEVQASTDDGDLGTVAWSLDGRTIFAAGTYGDEDSSPVLAWDEAGTGEQRLMRAAQDNVMSLIPLPDGSLLAAAHDPWLGRLRPDGAAVWAHRPSQAQFRGQLDTLSVSNDGTRIGYGYALFGEQPAQFDLRALALTLSPPSDAGLSEPRQDGLPIEDWVDSSNPTLGGRRLILQRYEMSRSLAIHPTGDRFVLGSDWRLRAFDAANAKLLWTRPVPEIVWAVNITSNGRLVVAAYGDGTIRWHRMSDGAELLAFMPLPNRTDCADSRYQRLQRRTMPRPCGCTTPTETPTIWRARSSPPRRGSTPTWMRRHCSTRTRHAEASLPSTIKRWRSAPTANCHLASSAGYKHCVTRWSVAVATTSQ